jgi:hypothetical protein
VYKTVSREANSINSGEVESWEGTILLHFMAKYSLKDIFNVGECALLYSLLADKMHIFQAGNCSGMEVNKERIIFHVCANLDGTDKFPTLLQENQNSHGISKTHALCHALIVTVTLLG